ncbi:MAG: dihydrolipoyl dehydrogenase [Candidatus Tectimicrobiota bacterium]|nr:MAG: dihydrolipoyl dehydrogenase [Candidatus Tectomicrobia bacterium]
MVEQHGCDLIVIGGGPGGYVAAIRAAQLGLRVALVEREALGGVCLNWGCIPTKALLHAADLYRRMQRGAEFGLLCGEVRVDFPRLMARSRQVAERLARGVASLMRKHGIRVFHGQGRLAGPGAVAVSDAGGAVQAELRAPHLILATGARPRPLPGLPFDGERVLSSTDALRLQALPPSLLVIGAGAVGVEFAYFYNALGCRVTLVELLPRVLPQEDHDISAALQRALSRQGIEILTGTRVTAATLTAAGVRVEAQTPEGARTLEAAQALVAIGVQGNLEEVGLEAAGVRCQDGFIPVDAHCRTNVAGIYAIGDVTGPPCLAHVASAEGIAAVEAIAGRDHPGVNYRNIPACTYCQPQVASVGLSEAAARQAGHAVRVGRFPFTANGKALAAGEEEGFVKVVFDADSDELLGVHILGAEATELIAAAGLARTLETTHADILHTVHAHPTLSEALPEAVAQAYGEAIHL